MEFGPNQVHMAPFGLILNQNRSHMVWDASGMPPVPQNHTKNTKIEEIQEIKENQGGPAGGLGPKGPPGAAGGAQAPQGAPSYSLPYFPSWVNRALYSLITGSGAY